MTSQAAYSVLPRVLRIAITLLSACGAASAFGASDATLPNLCDNIDIALCLHTQPATRYLNVEGNLSQWCFRTRDALAGTFAECENAQFINGNLLTPEACTERAWSFLDQCIAFDTGDEAIDNPDWSHPVGGGYDDFNDEGRDGCANMTMDLCDFKGWDL